MQDRKGQPALAINFDDKTTQLFKEVYTRNFRTIFRFLILVHEHNHESPSFWFSVSDVALVGLFTFILAGTCVSILVGRPIVVELLRVGGVSVALQPVLVICDFKFYWCFFVHSCNVS